MADKLPLVSILISLYNVERFLNRSMLSDVRGQSYSNLEIILVDDGSTDSTPELCEQLSKEDDRIRVIHKENGGLGSARNAGLDAAIGEYIYFCDVDDTIRPNLVEDCVKAMTSHAVDMMVFGFHVHYDNPRYGGEEDVVFNERYLSNNEEIKAIFQDELLFVRNGNGFAWNKFYRRSFLEAHHFRFGGQRIQQDELFNMQIYPKLSSLYISDQIYYDYVVYKTGNNASRYIKNRYEIYLSIYEGLKRIFTEWGIYNSELELYVTKRFYSGISDVVFFNSFHPDAPFTIAQRKQYIATLLSRPIVQECLSFIDSANVVQDWRGKLKLLAMWHNNYALIALLRWIELMIARFKS